MAEGDQYAVNGSKCFITNGGEADIYIVFARTDLTKGPMGISALIIEKDTPGFSLGAQEEKFGFRPTSFVRKLLVKFPFVCRIEDFFAKDLTNRLF